MIVKYQEFLLEKEFSDLLESIMMLAESEGIWTGPNTIEWDLTADRGVKDEPPVTVEWDVKASNENNFIDGVIKKLENFLSRIPKDKIKFYFDKFVSSVANLPSAFRRKLLVAASVAFLAFSSLTSLMSSSNDVSGATVPDTKKVEEVKKEFKKIIRKSNFEEAQELVSFAEAGYSDDRRDTGNWIDVPGGRRFVGTKYGISAPVLQDFMGRLPKAEDMRNLKYSDALKIYRADYWDAQQLQEFADQNVANVLYDGCVNQGVEGMKEVLRDALRSLGVKITDSENPFNKKRIREANSLDPQKFFDAIKKYRESRYKEAATFHVHGDGWLNRLDNIKYEA